MMSLSPNFKILCILLIIYLFYTNLSYLMQKFTVKLPFFIKQINEMAIVPVKGSDRAAGFDRFSCSDNIVPARGKSLIKMGL